MVVAGNIQCFVNGVFSSVIPAKLILRLRNSLNLAPYYLRKSWLGKNTPTDPFVNISDRIQHVYSTIKATAGQGGNISDAVNESLGHEP